MWEPELLATLWAFAASYRDSFFLFVRWDFGYCGHSWPIVPASGDSEGDCSEGDCGEADGM
jgi:hypothetical protein